MSTADPLYFVLWLYTLQIICEAVPLTLEIRHHEPGTNRNVIHKLEIDDSVVQNANPQALASTGITNPTPVNSENAIQHDEREEAVKDASDETRFGDDAEAYGYYFDCSMPLIPPDIDEYEHQTRDMASQHQVSHGLIGSVMGCVNGIAMNVMAIGFNFANAILPNSFRHE